MSICEMCSNKVCYYRSNGNEGDIQSRKGCTVDMQSQGYFTYGP